MTFDEWFEQTCFTREVRDVALVAWDAARSAETSLPVLGEVTKDETVVWREGADPWKPSTSPA